MFLNVTTGQLSLSPSPKVSQRRTAPWARAETFFRFLVSSCSRAAPSCSRRREGTQPHRGPRRLDRSGAAQRTGESRARRQLGWSAEEGEQDRLACVEKKAAQSLRVRTVASTLQDGLNFGTFDRAITLKQRRFCFVSVHVSCLGDMKAVLTTKLAFVQKQKKTFYDVKKRSTSWLDVTHHLRRLNRWKYWPCNAGNSKSCEGIRTASEHSRLNTSPNSSGTRVPFSSSAQAPLGPNKFTAFHIVPELMFFQASYSAQEDEKRAGTWSQEREQVLGTQQIIITCIRCKRIGHYSSVANASSDRVAKILHLHLTYTISLQNKIAL